MPENDVAARALYDLATARAGEFIDGLRDLVADMMAARLAVFDLDVVRHEYENFEPAVRGALEVAGYSEDRAAAWAWRLRARVVFRVEDRLDGSQLAQMRRLYEAASAGGEFLTNAVVLIARALRRVPVHERPRLARALVNDLIAGRFAAGDGAGANVDALYAEAHGLARKALEVVQDGGCRDAAGAS